MAAKWEPREGEDVVDLRSTGKTYDVDRCGPVVQVKTITQTLVITTDGEKYNRLFLTPVSEGRYSSRQLVRASDDRVLCVQGRLTLEAVARVARNLADLPRTDPADITAALARVVNVADQARRSYADLLAGKTTEVSS
jgi:hypothetical protein